MRDPLKCLAITTSAEAEEAVAALLERETGHTPGSHTNLLTGALTVSVFAALTAQQLRGLRARLQAGLRELNRFGLDPAPGRISIRQVPPQDWAESWKRHFRPIDIAGRLLVKPTWNRRQPKAGQALVLLDPGLSFGTGQHATTRFCLEQLVALRRPGTEQSLLDAGTGSGILALAGCRLGYQPVEAFDFDPDCVRTTRANAALNGIRQLQLEQADVTRLPRRPARCFDVVCANLMHDLLMQECDRITARVAPGGTLVLAGILTEHFPAVASVYGTAGWEVVADRTEAEWHSGAFQRRAAGGPAKPSRAPKQPGARSLKQPSKVKTAQLAG
jgi:ribosomal protein L11 methyltransferase